MSREKQIEEIVKILLTDCEGACTDKIMGFENKRGIHTLISMLDDMEGDE